MRVTPDGCWEPDGSPSMRPHPTTGHLNLVSSWELICYFNGQPQECVQADEESGVIEVAVKNDQGGFVYLDGLPRQFRTRFLVGTVRIEWTPIDACCRCVECCNARAKAEWEAVQTQGVEAIAAYEQRVRMAVPRCGECQRPLPPMVAGESAHWLGVWP